MISHKEMRFLLPVAIAFIFIVCKGFDWLIQQYHPKWLFRLLLPVLATMNIILLFIKILTPAHEAIKNYEFIYNYAQKQPATLVYYDESPYRLVGVEVNFYKNKNLDLQAIHDSIELKTFLAHTRQRAVIFLNPRIAPEPVIAGFKKEKIYCILPGFFRYLNFFDWQSRSYIWVIYRLYPDNI